ncbi:39S ribosomal protein L50, mitochondrial isoform X2 [Protopterus annectens]|uniref:39S ribosomal protein L50, mitochondrial isoform X2 n=1 Tax=Protopterus annectens TaxID=7888 RepID=UPI001CFA69B4|nr:39S ribosomal protein L50, mitochondrial isoform X2 [Protopterus annectens]
MSTAVFIRKKKDEEDIVVVSGQLELTPSQPVPFEYEKPPARSKRYTPPDNVENRVEYHFRHIVGTSLPKDWLEVKLEDQAQKFIILANLSHELQHSVPNSRLHLMKTPRDILDFYKTPVKDTSKFDDLASLDLPSNLRIRWGYEETIMESVSLLSVFGIHHIRLPRSLWPGCEIQYPSIHFEWILSLHCENESTSVVIV